MRGNLEALRHTLEVLGSDWGLILTDVTRGAPGNDERLGFLFDRRRVQVSDLDAELVVPQEELDDVAPDALQRQFAHTPYAVSFRCGDRGRSSSSRFTCSTATRRANERRTLRAVETEDVDLKTILERVEERIDAADRFR